MEITIILEYKLYPSIKSLPVSHVEVTHIKIYTKVSELKTCIMYVNLSITI